MSNKHAPQQFEHDGFNSPTESEVAQRKATGLPTTIAVKSRPYCTFCGGDFGKHDLTCVKATGSATNHTPR